MTEFRLEVTVWVRVSDSC